MVYLSLILELAFTFLFAFPVFAQVYLNELLPNPSTAEPATEWLELYNASSSALTLTNYTLEDADHHVFTLPEATISAHGYLVFYGSDGIPSLNNSEDTISFYDTHHQLLNQYHYQSAPEDLAWARVPDGGDFSSQPQSPTPNQANPTPTPTPTPVPSPTPSSSSIPTPTPTPTSTPTPSPSTTPTPQPSASPQILGLKTSNYPDLKLTMTTATPSSISSLASSSAASLSVSTPSAQTLTSHYLLFVMIGFSFLLLSLTYFFFFV